MSAAAALPVQRPPCVFASGAVGEGGHHVPSALGHCPAVLLCGSLEAPTAPGAVRVEGEHLLQVLKHVVEQSATEALLLELPPLPAGGLAVGLEVALKVPPLVGLMVGVVVVVLVLLLTERVSEEVVEVEGLEVLVEVVVGASAAAAALALPR